MFAEHDEASRKRPADDHLCDSEGPLAKTSGAMRFGAPASASVPSGFLRGKASTELRP